MRQSAPSRSALPVIRLALFAAGLRLERLLGIGRRSPRGGAFSRYFLGSRRQAWSEVRIFVFRSAYISLHVISVNFVDDHLHGLRIVGPVDPDGFVEIYFFLLSSLSSTTIARSKLLCLVSAFR